MIWPNEETHQLDKMANDKDYAIIVQPGRFSDNRGYSWFPSFIQFDNQVFYIQAFQKNNELSLQCHFHGTEAESKKYFCDISAENDALPRFKAKINFSRDVISVDIPKTNRNIKTSTFTISMDMAKQLWNENEEFISFRITIKRE